MNYDRSEGKRLRLPVRFINGHWEFYLGGAVPVRDGTIGELAVSELQIDDEEFLRMVTREMTARVLPEGAPLMIALNVPGRSGTWNSKEHIDVPARYLPCASPTFVPVRLAPPTESESDLLGDQSVGGLWLKVIGIQKAELFSGPVSLPDELCDAVAQSLNHAFTVLSEKLETQRISHTGNVYTRVFYMEPTGKWYPLEVLRGRQVSRAESRVMAEAWAQIEQQIGWCSLPPVAAKPGPRRG